MNAFDRPSPKVRCLGLFDNDAPDRSESAYKRPFYRRQLGEGIETEDGKKKQEMDALLCQAMTNLSLEERKKQEDILHGSDETVEDESLVNSALEDLDNQLQSIKQNSMYEVAERIKPDFVSARSFRVMFLRANEYDPIASADQMLRFFDLKYRLFGIEKLVEDITLSDLNEEDIARLKTGRVQLAGRDRSGRQILTHFAGTVDNLESWLRILYFVKMKALEDEETQLRGVVAIWFAIGEHKANKAHGRKSVEGFMAGTALPQRKQAIHICVDEMWQYAVANTLTKFIKGNMRARMRVHRGSPTECQYQLAAYGIGPHSLRLDSNGKVELTHHLNWIQSCSMEDKFFQSLQPSKDDNGSSIAPNRNDVLFTGGKIVNHLGNRRFHAEVQSHSQVYDEGKDETKRQIATTVIEKMHESGSRFLQRQKAEEGTGWKVVPPGELRKKVMQAFRNRRRLAEKRKNDDAETGTLILGSPLPNDVIFGRGQRNPGSQLLQRLIKEHGEEYESLLRGDKMGLVETIIQTIKDNGGRLLVKLPATNGGGGGGEELPDRWVELAHANAKDRISKYFRNYRRGPAKAAT